MYWRGTVRRGGLGSRVCFEYVAISSDCPPPTHPPLAQSTSHFTPHTHTPHPHALTGCDAQKRPLKLLLLFLLLLLVDVRLAHLQRVHKLLLIAPQQPPQSQHFPNFFFDLIFEENKKMQSPARKRSKIGAPPPTTITTSVVLSAALSRPHPYAVQPYGNALTSEGQLSGHAGLGTLAALSDDAILKV